VKIDLSGCLMIIPNKNPSLPILVDGSPIAYFKSEFTGVFLPTKQKQSVN